MTHFAEIDENDIVIRVIVAEQDFIDSGAVGNPNNWIQTSYNTNQGIHLQGKTPLRKNFAGKGFKYDRDKDAFIPPKPYNSWILNEEKCVYEPPKKMPDIENNQFARWNESLLDWEIITF